MLFPMELIAISTFLLLFMSSSVLCSPWKYLPKDCGRSRAPTTNRTTRVVNGNEASLGQFPWLVRLGERGPNNQIHFFCGGALINRYFIISAAHCGEYGDIIRIGEADSTTDIDCDESVCAPPHQDILPRRYLFLNFCLHTITEDLMLIELAQPAVFNDFVQPICLSKEGFNQDSLVGKELMAPGWGSTNKYLFEVPTKLLFASLPVITRKKCLRYAPLIEYQMICLLDESEIGSGMCRGDSGGPASVVLEKGGEMRHYLVGVASFVAPSCGLVTAYVNVSMFLEGMLDYVDKA